MSAESTTALIRLTAAELAEKIHAREVSAVEVARAHLERIAEVDGQVHAFLHVAEEAALESATLVDESLAAGTAPASPLAGVPLALKDVFTTADMPTTAGSKILDGWRPPYDATVTTRLRAAGITILGKTNMDEFAMGSSTEHSAYGPTHNPWDLSQGARRLGRWLGRRARRVRGAARDRHRHRWLDPPARRVHRHGRGEAHLRRRVPLRADRLRVLAGPGRAVRAHGARCRAAARGDRRPRPARLHLDRRAGPRGRRGRPEEARGDLSGLRVGVVRELGGEGYQPGVRASFEQAVAQLEKLGAELIEVSCPHFEYGLAAYYLILPSEVSSNLARFDAMRYGLRVAGTGARPRRSWPPPARPGSAPRSSAGSSSARTRCRRATTTPTTGRRRRCAR